MKSESPFYRVSVKVLVFDSEQKLLVLQNDTEEWELPGGGWEHGETLEECVRREIMEEVGLEVRSISEVQFVYTNPRRDDYMKLCIVVQCVVHEGNMILGQSDGIIAAQYVSRSEFDKLNFEAPERKIQQYANKIWKEQN